MELVDRALDYNLAVNYDVAVKYSMLELGKIEEGRVIDVNSYLSSRKAKTGLSSDRLPQGLREFTPAEIKSSVVEAGRMVVATWLCSQLGDINQ